MVFFSFCSFCVRCLAYNLCVVPSSLLIYSGVSSGFVLNLQVRSIVRRFNMTYNEFQLLLPFHDSIVISCAHFNDICMWIKYRKSNWCSHQTQANATKCFILCLCEHSIPKTMKIIWLFMYALPNSPGIVISIWKNPLNSLFSVFSVYFFSLPIAANHFYSKYFVDF